jgi:multidrug resistance efflux pump
MVEKPRRHRLSGLLLVVALAACAGENIPETQLSRAQLAVDRAVAAQAGVHAPTELARAQSELTAARAAIDQEDYTKARRLADQAEADATLAEKRAQAAIEAENLGEMRGTVGDLRKTALPPPAALVPQ